MKNVTKLKHESFLYDIDFKPTHHYNSSVDIVLTLYMGLSPGQV